ncbi:AAA family ATPase [Nanoarchaeota archaeon]
MIIQSLRLKNIRSYTDQTIDFPEGSVLLSGDIGSGKSSILLAIEFALFGTDLDRLSGNALLRKGTNEGMVELKFKLNNQEITVQRNLKKGKTTISQTAGCIVTNGIKKDGMPVELKHQLIEALGYPAELASKKRNFVFRYTVYTPQEDMKEILIDDQETRLDTLRKIFNIDKYKRIRENCQNFNKKLRSKKRELEIKIENLDELNQQLQEKNNTLNKNNTELNTLNPKIGTLTQEISQIKTQILETEEKIKQLQELKKQLEVTEAQERVKFEQKQKDTEKIDQIKLQLQETQTSTSLEQLQNQIDEDEKLINIVLEKKTSLTEKHRALNIRINELQNEIETSNQKIRNLPEQKQRLEELKRKIQDIQDYKNKKQELENSLEKLNLALKEYEINKGNAQELKRKILQFAQCPTCQQDVPKEHKQKINKEENEKILLYEKRMQECFDQRKQNQIQLEILKEKIDQNFEHEKEYERLNVEIKNLEETNLHLQEKINEFETKKTQEQQFKQELEQTQKTNLEQKQEQIKKNKVLLENLKEKQRLETQLKELQEHDFEIDRDIRLLITQKTDLKLKIGMNEKIEDQYREIKKQLEQKQDLEKQLMMEKTRLTTEISNLQSLINTITEEINKKNQIKQKVSKIKQTHNWLDTHFLNLMSNMEKHIMFKIHQEFNELFREWFDMLIEDENITAKLDDRFNPIIEQNGYEVSINHLSGGERTSIALAYRLALNKVVNDVISTIKTKDLLILDEPTDGFSSEQLDKVRDVLEELGVKQTIIVSHENKVESFVDKVIKIHKREGVSEIV